MKEYRQKDPGGTFFWLGYCQVFEGGVASMWIQKPLDKSTAEYIGLDIDFDGTYYKFVV